MRLKNKFLTLAIAGCLSCGLGGGVTNAYANSPAVSMQSEQNISSEKAQSIPLITDEAGVLGERNTNLLTGEQNKIHQKNDVSVNYRFYTYIYESDKPAKEAATEIAKRYSQEGADVPFIFLLNNKDGSYHFVEDTKLAPYVSSAYLSSLANQVFANGITSAGIEEYVIRADSTIMMSVDGDFAFTGKMPINQDATKEYMTIQNFAAGAESGRHAESKDANLGDQDEKESGAKDNSTPITVVAAFLIACASIGIVFWKRKRNAIGR